MWKSCGFFAAALLFSSLANAELISTDWKVEGDGLATYDSVSDLEWLDITLTVGNSVSSALQRIANGEFEGFRVATQDEVRALFKGVYDQFGLTSINWEATYINSPALRDPNVYINSFFGNSYRGQYEGITYGYHYGSTENVSAFTGVFINGADNRIYNSTYVDSSLSASYAQAGVFLVSEGGATYSSIVDPSLGGNKASTVPLQFASAFSLLGLGLMGFGLRRNKR